MAREKTNGLGNYIETKKAWELLVILVVTAIIWNLPTSGFDIDGLTVVQQHVIAISVFATLSWLTECIPAWTTSLSIMSIMCVTVSRSAFGVFKGDGIGELLDLKEIVAPFADPIIMFFLAGFTLAIAASKSGLDTLLARNLIKPSGNKSENVLLGFPPTTGLSSMFISNTATATSMLIFLTPVFAALPANGKGRIALTMSIPTAANLGGVGTPIGTPPSLIAIRYLSDPASLNTNIDFIHQIAFTAPLVIVLPLLSWRIVLYFFPFTQKTTHLRIDGEVHRGWHMWVVIIAFVVTVLLWVIPEDVTGIDTDIVSTIPMAIFTITGVITAKDMQEINWSVIWMVAGGSDIGLGMNGLGLADTAIESIPFGNRSPIVILTISGLTYYFLSNFISSTATAALLVPILAVVCRGMDHNLDGIGDTSTVLIGITIVVSTAMCFPISTPLNAIAYSTGFVKQNDMLKVGLTSGVVSLALGYILLCFIGQIHFLG